MVKKLLQGEFRIMYKLWISAEGHRIWLLNSKIYRSVGSAVEINNGNKVKCSKAKDKLVIVNYNGQDIEHTQTEAEHAE